MARKGWTSLSAAYRARLEKGGISRKDYESGQPIQKARGHSNTPENPRAYSPSQYSTYHTKRETLIAEVEERKGRLWGDSAKWNAERASRNIRSTPPTMAQLRWAAKASDEEIMDAIRESPKDYSWLGYH